MERSRIADLNDDISNTLKRKFLKQHLQTVMSSKHPNNPCCQSPDIVSEWKSNFQQTTLNVKTLDRQIIELRMRSLNCTVKMLKILITRTKFSTHFRCYSAPPLGVNFLDYVLHYYGPNCGSAYIKVHMQDKNVIFVPVCTFTFLFEHVIPFLGQIQSKNFSPSVHQPFLAVISSHPRLQTSVGHLEFPKQTSFPKLLSHLDVV